MTRYSLPDTLTIGAIALASLCHSTNALTPIPADLVVHIDHPAPRLRGRRQLPIEKRILSTTEQPFPSIAYDHLIALMNAEFEANSCMYYGTSSAYSCQAWLDNVKSKGFLTGNEVSRGPSPNSLELLLPTGTTNTTTTYAFGELVWSSPSTVTSTGSSYCTGTPSATDPLTNFGTLLCAYYHNECSMNDQDDIVCSNVETGESSTLSTDKYQHVTSSETFTMPLTATIAN